ncbi:hypothetical protein DFH11DRAFT_449542 [Phellopilus nigrolimitatus]|nr:hypothetical protein DFH11DRAFT_449542 [Phellopilus nigrolimitatus]
MSPEKKPSRIETVMRNPDVSRAAKDRAMQQLDGVGGASACEEVPEEETHEEAEGSAASEDNLDPETVRNTKMNEGARRVPTHASPDADVGGPARHVGFADEARPTRVLAGHKAALHNPRSSDEAREHSRGLLAFHGERSE